MPNSKQNLSLIHVLHAQITVKKILCSKYLTIFLSKGDIEGDIAVIGINEGSHGSWHAKVVIAISKCSIRLDAPM